MFRILAVVSVLIGSLAAHAKELTTKDMVLELAADPATVDNQWKIATSNTGSVWSIRVRDLAEVYQHPSNNPRIWVYIDHRRDKSIKSRESRIRYAISCVNHQYKTLGLISYSPDGSVINTNSFIDNIYGYEDIAPDTMTEAVEREVCVG